MSSYFADRLEKDLLREIPDSYTVLIQEDIAYGQAPVLSVQAPQDPGAFTLPLSEYDQRYRAGESYDRLENEITSVYESACLRRLAAESGQPCLKIHESSAQLTLQLMPQRKAMKEQLLHRSLADIALIFVEKPCLSFAPGVPVQLRQQKILAQRGLTTDSLLHREEREDPMEFRELDQFAFLLTTRSRAFGTKALFYPKCAGFLAECFGSAYLLPISLHECLMVPKSAVMSRDELQRRAARYEVRVPAKYRLSRAILHLDPSGCLQELEL